MAPGVPAPQAAHVLAFCREALGGAAPVRVPCAPDAAAEALDCFRTVDRRVQSDGGRRVLGWAIWELPGVLIEAEFHAVWQRPSDGALQDIARHQARLTSIVFVPDAARQYLGRQVDNVRRPLCADPRVRQFIYLAGRRFALLNAGALADRYDLSAEDLPPRLRKELAQVTRQLAVLGRRIFGP